MRRGNIDVVGTRQIVVFRSAEKAEAVGEALEDTFGEDEAAFFRLRAENLEDQLLLAHPARARDVQLLGDLREIGDVLFFQLSEADAWLVIRFGSSFFCHIS